MYLLQLYLVTVETFVVQRSQTSPPRMGYTTLENTLDHNKNVSHAHDVHVQRFQDSNERRDWRLLLQEIYFFVNEFEAMFSTKQLKIFKGT